MARGALRPKSPFYGSLELLSQVDLSLSRREGREMDTATESSVIRYYESIRNDPEAFAHSCLFVEWLLFSITGSEPSHPMFHLIGSVLDNFAAGPPFWPVLCSGIEKALRLSGFAMELDRCVRCGNEPGNSCLWDDVGGGRVCGDCSEGNEKSIPAGILVFLRKTRNSPIEETRRIGLWKGGYRQCFDILRSFAEVHLDRRMKLKSLSVLEDLENDH
jgi:DNA repair protein RecO (recombination protein O)